MPCEVPVPKKYTFKKQLFLSIQLKNRCYNLLSKTKKRVDKNSDSIFENAKNKIQIIMPLL